MHHATRALSLLLSAAAGAQTSAVQFTDLRPSPRVPSADLFATEIAAADVDGDGDRDVVVGDAGGRDQLWLNDGQRRFAVAGARLPHDGVTTRGIALADVDADGDVDVVLAKAREPGAQNRLYLNDGRGTFTDATASRLPVVAHLSADVVAGDVDRDGDVDLVFAGTAGCSPCPGHLALLYLNDGTGTFRNVSATHLPPRTPMTAALALGDVDGDGDLDLVFANIRNQWNGSSWGGGQDFLYLNDGSGRFVDATAQLPADNSNTGAVVPVDVDGDRDLDLVLAGSDNDTSPPSPIRSLYLNDGRGRFTDATAARMPSLPTSRVLAGDADGDGDVDLMVSYVDFSRPELPRLLRNDGSGSFAEAPLGTVPFGRTCWAWDVGLLTDLDGDADADALWIAWQHPIRFLTNAGNGRLTDTDPPRLDCALFVAIAHGDIDGDGDVDAALVHPRSSAWSEHQILLGDGRGHFTSVLDRLPQRTAYEVTNAVALADFDRDGDIDLLTGSSPAYTKGGPFHGENRMYRNDGTGRFALAPSPPERDATAALAVADLDADGDLDFVAVNYPEPARVYLNDGTARFTPLPNAIPAGAGRRRAAAAGDVDRDGDVDLLLGVAGQDVLLRNDGTGRFADVSATNLPVDAADTVAVAFADIDGDRDLDAVLADAGGPARVHRNDGTGRFTALATLPVTSAYRSTLVSGDVDEDGDVDLLFGSRQLFLNDGTGNYRPAPERVAPMSPVHNDAAALLDVDRDGDLDLFASDHLYLNLQRQVHAPELAYPGGPFPIEVFARPGYGTMPHAAMLIVGARGLVPPVHLPPLGLLGVDPQVAVVTPPLFLAPPAGRGTFLLGIPNLAGLRGREVFAQGLFAPTPQLADLRLGNVLAHRVQ